MHPDVWIATLPEDRREAVTQLRDTFNAHLPTGYEERVGGGMLHWVVPHSTYPAGYHCHPEDPLPFISLANRKNYVALYHMGLYTHPEVLQWFRAAYPNHARTKLDMGKSCVRFKKMNDLPLELMAELAGKFTPAQWIALYEEKVKD